MRTVMIAVAGLAAASTPCGAAANDVARAYEAALQASPTPLSLVEEQTWWLRDRENVDPGELAGFDAERVEILVARAGRDRAAWNLRVTTDGLASGCVPIALRACQNTAGGYMNGPDGARLFWQIQTGHTYEGGYGAGFVLLAEDGPDGGLRPVAWDFAGAHYEQPVFITDPDVPDGVGGRLHVAAPGVHGGTGAGNADVIFRWSADPARPLVQIDNTSWRDDLAEHLPAGLEVWKGVDFRYGSLFATTSLWRTNDANCCPTGGEAALEFTINEDHLRLVTAHVSDALLDLAMTTPTAVFDYAGRRAMCARWLGEEPYDAERAARIAGAIDELRCDALEADGAALRETYAGRADLIQIIARAEAN